MQPWLHFFVHPSVHAQQCVRNVYMQQLFLGTSATRLCWVLQQMDCCAAASGFDSRWILHFARLCWSLHPWQHVSKTCNLIKVHFYVVCSLKQTKIRDKSNCFVFCCCSCISLRSSASGFSAHSTTWHRCRHSGNCQRILGVFHFWWRSFVSSSSSLTWLIRSVITWDTISVVESGTAIGPTPNYCY